MQMTGNHRLKAERLVSYIAMYTVSGNSMPAETPSSIGSIAVPNTRLIDPLSTISAFPEAIWSSEKPGRSQRR